MEDDPVMMFLKGAGLMLVFLRKVRNHRDVSIEKRRILEDESYSLMRIHHHLTKSGMERVLESVRTGEKPSGDKEMVVFDTLNSLMKRLGDAEAFLEEVQGRRTEILSSSMKTALDYLPPEAEIETTIHCVFGGHSDGYTVEDRGKVMVVLNLSMFLGDFSYLEAVLSHELHHMGLSSIEKPIAERSSSLDDRILFLLRGTRGEGLATYVGLKKVEGTRVSGWTEILSSRMARVSEHFGRLEDEIVALLGGESKKTQEELYDQFFARIGGAYFVGCRMADVIERSLGRDVLVELLRKDPVEFFLRYNSISAEVEEEYVFDERTEKMLRQSRAPPS